MTASPSPGEDASEEAYGGVFGAFPYALRATDSLLCKSYVVLGGLLAALVAVVFALGLVVVLGETVSSGEGSLTFSRAFFVFVGFLTVAPLVAPVLFVARRHRRGVGSTGYDRRLAAAGYAFVLSLYLALLVSIPASQQQPVSGPLAPVVEFLYALPQVAGLLPPVAAALAVWLLGRRGR